MNIYGTNIAAVLISPDSIQQRFPGVHTIWISHQEFNDVKFLGSQIRDLTVSVSVPCIQIQGNISNCKGISDGFLLSRVCPTQKRTDSGF